ncbi:uncharacterized protein LOC111074372 [Drosophila obscura]|uniref:uncharacterized protein LOC111074372 n=1 Tax=Drosophila obscura TaxID=7282 RepID=UPI000BA074DC|nr:uncharacterized protein LOC111074372 [Drosophila obscura]
MDFFGRKNDSEGKTPLENSEKISERVSEIGLVCRQIEYNAQKNLADTGRLVLAQGNQSPWEQKKTNHDDIKSWMCYQDNLSAEKKKKIKHNDIKRWVFTQNKHLKLGSNEMPSEETMLDGPQNDYEVLRELDEAERTLIAQEKLLFGLSSLPQETSSFDAYFNMTSSKDCDINMDDPKLSGDHPKQAAKNQHKGSWHSVLDAQKINGASPIVGKPVQYMFALPHPSLFAGSQIPLVLPAGYILLSLEEIKNPNHWSLRPN